MAKWRPKAIKPYSPFAHPSQPKPMYDDNAESMTAYHKGLILAMAKRYTGDELDEKLGELRFCSLKTAKEVIKNAEK